MSKQYEKTFGNVRKKSEKCWEARYSVNGEQRSFTKSTEDECWHELTIIGAKLKLGKFSPCSTTSLADYLQKWLQVYGKSSLRHSTYCTYENYFENHIRPHAVGKRSLSAVTTYNLQCFFNEKARGGRLDASEGGLSPKTLRNIRNALNVAFTQALREEIIGSNPVQGVKLPKDKHKEMRVLTKDEQATIESMILNSQDVSLQGMMIALYTGLRIGELLALTWNSVDFAEDPPSIYIRSTLRRQSVPDQDDPDYEIVRHLPGQKTAVTVGQTKTMRSYRKIFLPQAAALAAKQLYAWQQKMKELFGADFNSAGYVICTLSGGAMEPRAYSDKLDMIVKAAGIPHVNFHALRHPYVKLKTKKYFGKRPILFWK